MKTLILMAFAVTLSMTASASSGTYKAKKYTCAQLQNFLATEGVISVRHTIRVTTHRLQAACDPNYEMGQPFEAYVDTSDQDDCRLGWSCYPRPIPDDGP